MANIKKFVIVSPRQKWGGAIVLHLLCRCLMDQGYDARIFYTESYMYKKGMRFKFWIKWLLYTASDVIKVWICFLWKKYVMKLHGFIGYADIPVKGCKRKFFPRVSKNTVVVYPDVMYGNFLHAEKVVHWFLYYNRYTDSPDAYGKTDLFLCFREHFNDYKLNPDGKKLQLNYFDLNLYRQTNFGKRNGKCYIIRKGRDRKDLPEDFDGIVIDDLTEEQKVRVFNECEYCISYDMQTAYSGIAALCGCISVVVPEKGKSRSDYRGNDETSPGVAFGFSEEEIQYAIQTRSQLLERYRLSNEKSKEEAERFVEMCREYWKQ